MLRRDVDESVVSAASRTPFEAHHRVFVLERADTMNDEAANALLKTLEEPPPYVVLLLLTDRIDQVLPTISSRCQGVRFDPPGPEALAQRLQSQGVPPETATACARLSLGDGDKALALALGDGPALRAQAEAYARGPATARHWRPLLDHARSRGAAARKLVDAALADELAYLPKKEHRKRETEYDDRAKRVERRAATGALDHALQLVGLWYRDLGCVVAGAPELVHHTDRLAELTRRCRRPRQRVAAARRRARRRHARPARPQRQRGAGARGARLPARELIEQRVAMTEVRVHGRHATVRAGGLEDEVAVEEPLEIRVAGKPLAVTMRTPGHDEELALGFLHGEGLIDGPRPVGVPDLAANTVEVEGPLLAEPGARSFYTTSSCGVCGKGALEEVAVHAPQAAPGPLLGAGAARRPAGAARAADVRAHRRPARDRALHARGRARVRARGRGAPQRARQGRRLGAAGGGSCRCTRTCSASRAGCRSSSSRRRRWPGRRCSSASAPRPRSPSASPPTAG